MDRQSLPIVQWGVRLDQAASEPCGSSFFTSWYMTLFSKLLKHFASSFPLPSVATKLLLRSLSWRSMFSSRRPISSTSPTYSMSVAYLTYHPTMRMIFLGGNSCTSSFPSSPLLSSLFLAIDILGGIRRCSCFATPSWAPLPSWLLP